MESYENKYRNSEWSSESDVVDGRGGGAKMSNDQYCLRWNSYETNILATFEGLLDSEALSDVTLFCEGESFKAHRLVLAACSTHFAKIFSAAPLNGQLIVILDGTRSQDLHILLQFMYRGVAFLPSDRIESVLRTGEVLQVKGLFNGDGVQRGGPHRDGHNNRAWSPINDNQKKEPDVVPARDTSPVPTGRIALQPPPSADSPITHSLPIFPQQTAYSRAAPFSAIPSLYQTFTGFQRPDQPPSVKPSPSSILGSFSNSSSSGGSSGSISSISNNGNKSELPSPIPGGGRESASSSTYKFSPRHSGGGGGDRDIDSYEPPPSSSSSAVVGGSGRDTGGRGGKETPDGLGRSPAMRRPSSEPYDRSNGSPRPKLMSSDSTTDPTGSSPSRIFGGEGERPRLKTERPNSPSPVVVVDRKGGGGFLSRGGEGGAGGDFSPRDSLSRLSAQSNPRSEGAEAHQYLDLRTNDTEERIKRENNLETLRRLAQVNASGGGGAASAASSSSNERESQLATIQKMDLFRQATSLGRDHFLGGRGGVGAPLTAPLGIPASDWARIAQTVPDPAALSGEPTSGTGTKLKCPFCERTYGYETNLRAHIRQRHQGIRVPCPFCHRSFTRNNTVRRHIAREHRHHINPKMIPTKFGQTKVMPDQPYTEAMNQQEQRQQQQQQQSRPDSQP